MSPQRRTALVSVVAAAALIVIKLASGLASGSLGLVSESVHSGTDLVAALLTFFAVGLAVRPADDSHPYGHGKAEHLVALAEAAVLTLVSVGIGGLALARLAGRVQIETQTPWWAFAAIAAVIAIDVSRTAVSLRQARRYSSPALLSNALHFGSDLAGTLAVLAGLVAVRAGWSAGDSIAAMLVAVLVVAAAVRLIRRNVDVLMDRAPAEAVGAAELAIGALEPDVELRRLRLRQAAGRTFADVVIAVAPDAAVGQGHALAERVEGALHRALPGSDIVVHVEPGGGRAEVGERVRAAAMTVPFVLEVHDLSAIEVGDGVRVALHLKLPGELRLEQAHELAEEVERAIVRDVPEVIEVQTHLEPLAGLSAGHEVSADRARIEDAVASLTGRPPRSLRLLHTTDGLVVFVTLGLGPAESLSAAHATASEAEGRIRAALPSVAEVIVHTEPEGTWPGAGT